MSLVSTGLALLALGAAAAAVVALFSSVTSRARLSAALTCLVGLGGVLAGSGALAGDAWSRTFPHLLPLSEATFVVDPLSGLFMILSGGVAIAAGVYSVGYPHADELQDGAAGGMVSRTVQSALPLFAATLIAVPTAGNATTFLVLWELMAVASLVLVLAEHRARPEVGRAGVWYAAMTHAGVVAILLSLVLLAAAAGDESFAGIREAASGLPPATRSAAFLVAFAGFGSKAGLVPLHVWLPRAHAEAPSYVSALMSAAMVNLGVYGVLRVGFDLLGGGPQWWWLLVLGVAAASALYGVLQASVATDLKRLLAYSTTENLGLVFVGVGASGVFAAAGDAPLSGVLMIAAVLHMANHAAFKTALFLGAGSVLRSTGLRDLDRMGGLARPMPITTVLVGIGALGASGLPPGNGFVSEWLLLQGLIHSLSAASAPDVASAIAMPVAVGAVALTAGLGVATFVKAFGVGFLARPRSEEAAAATEAPRSMRAGMALAAAACAALALAPVAFVRSLDEVLATLPGIGAQEPVRGAVQMRLSAIAGSMSPLLIAVGLAGGAVLVVALVRLSRGWRPRRTALVWGCGGTRLSPRMQYTATAYAEPLTRVFDDVLGPEHDIDVTHHVESQYLVESVRYRQRVSDRLEARLYPPLLTAATRWAARARGLQNGSVHRYLAYGLVGLLVVLVVVGVTA
ncbi:MAG TPA: proton-conducting transporter membrane subunit [Nocardioides sp.]|uniref:proton-conducting transporter transmembrane domain-containing protein n=1 Tax=Nocardioides sp. TaxID=35761 RepID=UPI002E343CA3|nr:proton-conducting transporter membrane subunit [Nocardioides sp.]HEX5086376.1 proton-conducting transporter membrane subunit [Nocardioides sp.]